MATADEPIPFDFDAAVSAPFRMQPGLRRLPAGARQLTPIGPGSRHQREKLAVLSAFWPQALCAEPGFDAAAAVAALFAHAAGEHPGHWQGDGAGGIVAPRLGVAVDAAGAIEQRAGGSFGLGDEIARCLQGLPPAWRQAGLFALTFAEDIAIVDAERGTIPWLAVCLPSHWAPEHKLGGHFTAVHAPVADNTLLLQAAAGLMRLVSGGGGGNAGETSAADTRWERFVWNVTDWPRLHAHPARLPHGRWQDTAVAAAWLRSERQTFIPVPAARQAVFTIGVEVQPLQQALRPPGRAAALHAAIATMSPAVLAYRGLTSVREPLLAWLAQQAAATP